MTSKESFWCALKSQAFDFSRERLLSTVFLTFFAMIARGIWKLIANKQSAYDLVEELDFLEAANAILSEYFFPIVFFVFVYFAICFFVLALLAIFGLILVGLFAAWAGFTLSVAFGLLWFWSWLHQILPESISIIANIGALVSFLGWSAWIRLIIYNFTGIVPENRDYMKIDRRL